MRIKRLQCCPFGAMDDETFLFRDGLNVLAGENESGKSTIVEAIHAILFRGLAERRNAPVAKAFRERAFRYPDGDHARIVLEFEHEGETTVLTKHWQDHNPWVSLSRDGTVMRDPAQVDAYLADCLRYGESTYTNVLFARQYLFEQTIAVLPQDRDTRLSISQSLKKAVMELDGVPVETLQEHIANRRQALERNWDPDRDLPRNNRTIDDPYRQTGEVLEAYYACERIRLAIQRAEQNERLLNEHRDHLQEALTEKENGEEELRVLEPLEGSLTQRQILEPALQRVAEEITALAQIQRDWGVWQERHRQRTEEEKRLGERLQAVEDEKEKAGQARQHREEKQRYEEALRIEEEIRILQSGLAGQVFIDRADLESLDDAEDRILETTARLGGAVLVATLESASIPVEVTPGLSGTRSLTPGETVQAKGFVRVDSPGSFSLRITTGEQDPAATRREYQEALDRKERLLGKMGVSTRKEARDREREQMEKTEQRNGLERQLRALVGDVPRQERKKRLQEPDGETVRSLQEIAGEMAGVRDALEKVRKEKYQLEGDLDRWTKTYQDPDTLLERLVERKMERERIQGELNSLPGLPPEYAGADALLTRLRSLRDRLRELSEQVMDHRMQIIELKGQMPDESSEEFSRRLLRNREILEKKKRDLGRIRAIQETLERVLDRMDSEASRPLETMFASNLSLLTAERHRHARVDDELRVRLLDTRGGDALVPSLFSRGTGDGVALAFRLALIDQLFPEGGALILLDDPLVNLDPERKQGAVRLIRQAATRHQILFATCHPEVSQALGGNRIGMALSPGLRTETPERTDC